MRARRLLASVTGRLSQVIGGPKTRNDSAPMNQPPPLRLTQIRDGNVFVQVMSNWSATSGPNTDPQAFPRSGTFPVPGYCWVCKKRTQFWMDDQYRAPQGSESIQNWRERLACSLCGLNNRVRAAIHIFEQHVGSCDGDAIWLMEQVSPLFAELSKRYNNLVGSEFLYYKFASGKCNSAGVRHEDATQSSFESNSLDAVLSFDVFEHVPDYPAAFREACRILRKGGTMLFTVPFLPAEITTQVRARVDSFGEIEHLLPPQYHGDPVQPERGVLCFYGFGWDTIDALKTAGFSDAYTLWYESSDYGYLGEPGMALIAKK